MCSSSEGREREGGKRAFEIKIEKGKIIIYNARRERKRKVKSH